MHPFDFVIQYLFSRDIVTDEVDQIPSRPWQDFLKRFQHERINQHMVDGREVCADRHIIDVSVRFVGT